MAVASRSPAPAEVVGGPAMDSFETRDWTMLVTLALIWGSSFLFIANGLDSFDPVTIAFLRIALGVTTLVLVPTARRTPIARADWPRILVLGVVWMAIPLTLFPLAEQWVSSAVAGMLNGAMPIMVTAIASLMLRRVPNRATFVGLAIGFAGVVLIALPSFGVGGSETKGIVLVLVALVFYAVSANLHVPVTLRYGSLPVQLRVQAVGLSLTAPAGLWQARDAELHVVPVLSVVALGVLGTGAAFVIAGQLFARVGPTRGAVVTYLMPVVAMVLGAVFRDETIHTISVFGVVLVLAGAIHIGRHGRH